jgi:hypothetical protein
VGFTTTVCPVGLQIVGRRFDEATVLRAGAAFEAAQPWAEYVRPRASRPRDRVPRHRSPVDQLDFESLIDLALAARPDDADPADLACVGHMRAAVGLRVELADRDDAHLGDPLGQEVDLRADQIGDRERFLARQDPDRDRRTGGDGGVGALLDLPTRSGLRSSSSKSIRARSRYIARR